jgi:hypothetical protein
MRQDSQLRRTHNREASPKLLAQEGIAFVSNNGGAHLQITEGRYRFDFWPGTGLYWKTVIGRDKHKEGRGVFNLIRDIKRERSP